jgi:hypothetical protein
VSDSRGNSPREALASFVVHIEHPAGSLNDLFDAIEEVVASSV